MDDSSNPYQSPEKSEDALSDSVHINAAKKTNSPKLRRLIIAYLISIVGYLAGIYYINEYPEISKKGKGSDAMAQDIRLIAYTIFTPLLLSPAWVAIPVIIYRKIGSLRTWSVVLAGCVVPLIFVQTISFTIPTMIVLLWLALRRSG